MTDNILRNLRPVDNRTEQELIDDQFISKIMTILASTKGQNKS